MSNGSGVSRGDRNRNARLARLRALVPVGNAIVGIDLADAKQMVRVVWPCVEFPSGRQSAQPKHRTSSVGASWGTHWLPAWRHVRNSRLSFLVRA